jgi:hypothetical protein
MGLCPLKSVLDARGCSDWPSRAGETLVSLDSESKFEVEPFFVAGQGDIAIAWNAYGCDDLTRVRYIRRDLAAAFDKLRDPVSPNGKMATSHAAGRVRSLRRWRRGRRDPGKSSFEAPVELKRCPEIVEG